MKGKYIDIQNEVIQKYRIKINTDSQCRRRMHCHVKQRMICKWKQVNSIQCTFDLFHEIGHAETTKAGMRRAEAEYYATIWAIERFKEYGLEVPKKTLDVYQRYIDMTVRRGVRRGGTGYGELKLIQYK